VKFSFGNKNRSEKEAVLFVCVENAARSQMAEGFFRKYASDEYESISAGTRSTAEINPVAMHVMKEIGIDISKQKPKDITEDMMRNSTKIVNMGCMDEQWCPTVFLPNVIDWGIEDPKGKPVEKVREIRNDIEQRVKKLVVNLSKDKDN
jgi:arsenate reductase